MDSQQLYDKMLPEARKQSTAMAQQIADSANAREPGESGMFFGLTASLVFQIAATTLAVNQFRPGSPEGAAFIDTLFHEALRDAQGRWLKADIKQFETGN